MRKDSTIILMNRAEAVITMYNTRCKHGGFMSIADKITHANISRCYKDFCGANASLLKLTRKFKDAVNSFADGVAQDSNADYGKLPALVHNVAQASQTQTAYLDCLYTVVSMYDALHPVA